MFAFLKRLLRSYGFARPIPSQWEAFQASSHEQWLKEQGAISKNAQLVAIARKRDELKTALQKAIRQKTKRSGIYAELRALTQEEMRLESSR
jgi:hypothetical protein